jgi:hypothetical protein
MHVIIYSSQNLQPDEPGSNAGHRLSSIGVVFESKEEAQFYGPAAG